MTRVRSPRRALTAGLAGAIAVAVAAGALAQGAGNQVYRYEDAQGRVVYSDKPPPSDAKRAPISNSRTSNWCRDTFVRRLASNPVVNEDRSACWSALRGFSSFKSPSPTNVWFIAS